MMADRYYTTHNGLRGIAALLVAVYHLQLEPAYRLPLGSMSRLLQRGYLWVDLFFILSGFVLTRTYEGRLAGGRRAEIGAFLRARAVRIFPLHLIVLAVFAGVVLAARPQMAAIGNAPFWRFLNDPHVLPFAAQAALVQVWNGNATMAWNIPAWSISAEMNVYLTLPIVAVLTARWPRAASVAVAALAASIYAYIFVRRWQLDILDPLAIARCLAGFLVGVTISRYAAYAEAMSGRTASVLHAVAILAIVALLLSPARDVWVIPAFALLVLSTVNDRGPFARLLARRVPQLLGAYSFSIYLLNFPVLLAADMTWPHVRPLLAGWPDVDRRIAWSAAILVALILTASVTYRWIEAPIRLRMRSLTRIRRQRSVAVLPLEAVA